LQVHAVSLDNSRVSMQRESTSFIFIHETPPPRTCVLCNGFDDEHGETSLPRRDYKRGPASGNIIKRYSLTGTDVRNDIIWRDCQVTVCHSPESFFTHFYHETVFQSAFCHENTRLTVDFPKVTIYEMMGAHPQTPLTKVTPRPPKGVHRVMGTGNRSTRNPIFIVFLKVHRALCAVKISFARHYQMRK
jgi:hypothetical protein